MTPVRTCYLDGRIAGWLAILCAGAMAMPASSASAESPRVEPDGTVHVPAFQVPESSYLSEETRAALKRSRDEQADGSSALKSCPDLGTANRKDIPAIRKCHAEVFYKSPMYKRVRERYSTNMASQDMGGVYTEIFTPVAGIARSNKNRVLINVHGGGFQGGSRSISHLESIPIAAVGKIKVVSIDYRMGPEYTFPAASEDVAAVYRELIKSYKPKNIGLYGCSSGGVLTSQSVAWLQKENLALPGAIGIFCHGAPKSVANDGKDFESERSKWVRSDGAYFAGALFGANYVKGLARFPYYKGVDVANPLASPGDYDEVMRRFPPTLLVSGTRDFTLSATLVTHAQLVRLGVPADLHVWEGMAHAFFFDPAFPESREMYNVVVKFFDKHLGT